MLQILRKKGQSSVEYAVMIIVVIGALIAMQNYFKRGVQGRWHTSVDGVGDQYDPMFTTANIVHRVTGTTITNLTTQNVAAGIVTLRGDNAIVTETRTGFSRVDAE
ncbi:MAG: hypothetical protein IT395_00070 [Candidatus Omnitrophica bacterium]|nr:hypothetical protein [Candidatus Omnitrophota bacterium]